MTTAGDLLSQNGCPECEASVVRVSSELNDSEPPEGVAPERCNEYECARGHIWSEQVHF